MREHKEIIRKLFKILCSYKEQPLELEARLNEVMTGKFYPVREPLYEKDDTVTDALFVAVGYVVLYGFDALGDRQVLNIYVQDTIVAGKSFTEQKPSKFELVALAGAYVMKIGADHMTEVYADFSDAEELARLIMADMAEKDLDRLHLLKRDAETVVLDFYTRFPEFFMDNLMTDADIASYLLISESTLRNTRAKLIKEDKL
ncbi:Crp/Fnr family transcriptional regulator [Pedobacter frigoris]|uniref:Crp/Fnr family transcriptional regulator n=1 Tax=Pedobacter frigoris TaxID=2571272 RepID=A0A4U1CF61_9SPHI|nr:Crp/Fnr family transcriptional regulator [Pedobacter frigoris]TKC04223.1 Crp/Fnr family transcriptional regulator [Pedobacter frigoris]